MSLSVVFHWMLVCFCRSVVWLGLLVKACDHTALKSVIRRKSPSTKTHWITHSRNQMRANLQESLSQPFAVLTCTCLHKQKQGTGNTHLFLRSNREMTRLWLLSNFRPCAPIPGEGWLIPPQESSCQQAHSWPVASQTSAERSFKSGMWVCN